MLLRERTKAHGQRLAHIAHEMLAILNDTDRRAAAVVGLGVGVEYNLYRRYERRVAYGQDEPGLHKPRIEVVLFRVRQAVAGSIDSSTTGSTTWSVSGFMDQLARPFEADEIATLPARAISGRVASCPREGQQESALSRGQGLRYLMML